MENASPQKPLSRLLGEGTTAPAEATMEHAPPPPPPSLSPDQGRACTSGRFRRLAGSSRAQSVSQQANSGPAEADPLGGRAAAWGLWVLCPRPHEKTSIGLARCSSPLFLCPRGAWRAALLPRNHKARAAEALGSCQGGTGKPPASP